MENKGFLISVDTDIYSIMERKNVRGYKEK